MARTLTIDLGAHAVKVATWPGPAEGPPEGEAAQTVPQDGSALPSIADRVAALDTILRAHPSWLSGAHVVVAWPSDRAATHAVRMPFDDPDQIGRTLPFTLEAEVPFDLDEMVVAWRKGGVPGEVAATLVRRSDLSELIEALEGRGAAPRQIVCAGEAIALWGADALAPERVVAVVDVGHATTSVTVVRGGTMLAWRTGSAAGLSLTRAVLGALGEGASFGAAQSLKHGGAEVPDGPADTDDVGPALFGLAEDATDPDPTGPIVRDDLPTAARAALDRGVTSLLAEVRASLVQLEDDLAVGVDEIVLVGGGARLEGLADRLASNLGVPVRPATASDGSRVPEAFAVARAIGRVLTEPQALTGLRVGDLAYRGGLGSTRTLVGYGAAFVGIFLVAAVASTVFQVWRLARERTEIEGRVRAEVAALVEDLPEDLDAGGAVSVLADLVIQAQTEAEFLGSPDEAPPTIDALYRISNSFPPHPDVTVSVDTLDVNPEAILIEGTTDGFAQVDKIGEALTAGGGFGTIEATPGNKDAKGRLAFRVSIARGSEDGAEGVDEGAETVPVEGEAAPATEGEEG
jgi:Tfp pilus assembly PilM family ATPase